MEEDKCTTNKYNWLMPAFCALCVLMGGMYSTGKNAGLPEAAYFQDFDKDGKNELVIQTHELFYNERIFVEDKDGKYVFIKDIQKEKLEDFERDLNLETKNLEGKIK